MTLNNIFFTSFNKEGNAVFDSIKSLFQSKNLFHRVSAETFDSFRAEVSHLPKAQGVYLVRRRETEGIEGIVYIGKAGKLTKHQGQTVANRSDLRKRYERWTPYCYQSEGPYSGFFEYDPNFGVNELKAKPFEERYASRLPLSRISTDFFNTSGLERQVSPAFVESLLLQVYFRDKGALPPANQEL